MPIPEGDWQNLSTVHSPLQPKPGSLVSANVIAPVTFLTVLSGNTVIKTITPPITSMHMLAFQFAGTAGVDATGNVTTLTATVAGQILLLIYNPNTQKYVPVG